MMQTIRSNSGVKGYTMIEIMIVVTIVGVLVGMSLPSFRRMNNNAQVERFVQQLQMEEQALRQFAIFNRGYPTNVNDTVCPAGLQEYLPAGFNWSAPTPLGGNWKWEGKARARGFFFEYGITVSTLHTPLLSSNLFLQADLRMDDGSFTNGVFQKNNQAISPYSYSLQSYAPPAGIWGTTQ
jgi:prepilin-type N-terminal cleavage/methylation domain-containing protein